MGQNLKSFPFKMTRQFHFKGKYVHCGACTLAKPSTYVIMLTKDVKGEDHKEDFPSLELAFISIK